jgi:acyl dehydratase
VTDDELLTPEMRACIGSATPTIELPDEISASDVRRFVNVTGETNPIYRDEAYAKRLGYERCVVPQLFVVAQFFRPRELPDGSMVRIGIDWPQLALPPEYTNTRNGGQEYAFYRPVYVGDRLTVQARLTDLYVRRGRLGIPVIYVVSETVIRNQHGDLVVREVSTTAKLPARPAKAS